MHRPVILYYSAVFHFRNNQDKEGSALIEEALKLDEGYEAGRVALQRVELKTAGNDAFKRGNFAAAVEQYSAALDAGGEEVVALRETLLSNRATAHVKLAAFESAISDATDCLELVPDHVKAKRARAQAHAGLDNFREALTDLKDALQHSKEASMRNVLQKEIREIREKRRESRVSSRPSARSTADETSLQDPYRALGVSQWASMDEIKRAYRTLSLKTHPDRAGGSRVAFHRVNAAYELLSDPQRRRRHLFGFCDYDSDTDSE